MKERGRTTNGLIGPDADQIYEIWNLTIFLIWIIRGMSKLCTYTKHSFWQGQICLNNRHMHLFKFNWHFCTPIMVNISIPPPLDPKFFYAQRIFFKRSKRVVTKIGSEVGAYVNYKKNNLLISLISSQKLYFGHDDAIYNLKKLFENDVISTDMKSAGIHLLNQYSFRHTQPFSFLDKSTGPILPFVVLAL